MRLNRNDIKRGRLGGAFTREAWLRQHSSRLEAEWGTLRLLTLPMGSKVHEPIVRMGMIKDDLPASNSVVLVVEAGMLCFVTL